MHAQLREQLRKAIVIDLRDRLYALKTLLSEKLKQVQIGDHVVLLGVVDTVGVKAIYTSEQHLNVEAGVVGRMNVILK